MFIPNNFMALHQNLSAYDASQVVILPVPYDATLSYRPGSRLGPRAIIEASRNVETFDLEIMADPSVAGIHTLDEVEPDMRGPEHMVSKVQGLTKPLLADRKFVIMLGGEHSLTCGAVAAHKARHEHISVLQIDAHLDLRDEYEGTPYNHACVMRRIFDLCEFVQVGIRSGCAEEYEFARRKKLRPFFAHDLDRDGKWMEQAIARLGENVYITIDLDGLDPAVIPAVGTPEPGGLGWFETLKLLRMVCERRHVVGADVMELSPIPGNVQGDFAAAKLVYKLIGYRFGLQDQSG
ncbi:MAG: agmatinase [Deltaproteobacteria bacterium]|nr:agmatinase [Deltaproteobacteria bacterium]